MSKKQIPNDETNSYPRKRAPLASDPPPKDEYNPFEDKLRFHAIFNKAYTDAMKWAAKVIGWRKFSLSDIEKNGFREGEHIEWYAAAILRQWYFLSAHYCGGIGTDRVGHRNAIIINGRIQSEESLSKELDRLIAGAQILLDPLGREKRKSGKGLGRQQAEARKAEWAMYQVHAERLWKKYPRRSAVQIAETIQGIMYRKEGKKEAIRTITNRIRRPA